MLRSWGHLTTFGSLNIWRRRLAGLLAPAGTDTSRLIAAQIWLTDMRLFEEHNAAWNAWVDRRPPPVRACVRADLYRPNLLVEIMVTAAK